MLGTSVSFAHSGGGHHAAKPHQYEASEVVDTPFGREGDPTAVTRTVTVDMTDNMRFTPAVLTVNRGETVRLKVVNKGQLLHELVLGTPEELDKHSEAMRKHPGMEHDEPQMVHVQPGDQAEVVWQFSEPGEFQFGCLLPGHFEAGMVGRVVVQ
ncbi:MAG TPA: cupredoxin family protein [Burkholderiaceae bacterium]|nr:cupredoxin family protein [Burkholderiaceae bacterium]